MPIKVPLDISAMYALQELLSRGIPREEIGLFYITPSGYPQQFPQVAIAQKYSVLMHKYAQELGLTPAARSRLIAGKESGSGDEMEDLLNE